MLWRQLEGWQPSFIISLVVTKLGGLSFRQWLWVLFGDEAITIPWSVGDYYNTLGRRQFYCLFNSLSGLTTKKASRQSVPAPLWGELMYYRKFPLQRASNAPMLPWHDVIMRNSNIWLPLFHSLMTGLLFQWRLWVVGLTIFVVIGGTVGCRNGNLRCHCEDLKLQVLGRNRIGIDCKVSAIIFQYQSVDISLITDYER